MDITAAAQQHILVLDGAMGTMIQRHNLDESDFRTPELKDHPKSLKGNNDLLSLTRPELIRGIHEAYFEAGADIVETNTFSATTIAQADYGLEAQVDAINISSAKLAREAADAWTERTPDRPRFVAGSMGPTNRTASLSPDVNNPGYRAITFEELQSAYKQQAIGLAEGGVDVLLVETVFDTLNAKAALFGIQEAFISMGKNLPIMVSGTIVDASGRTLSGQTTSAFWISVSHIPLFSIGLNCALGAEQLTPYLDTLSKEANTRISAHPNAGLPNEMGGYDQGPDEMALQIESYLKRGLINIVGGCCGTTPEHIRAIAHICKNYTPRTFSTPAHARA